MNPPLEEQACLYVLDQLDAGERAAFAARLRHDAELATLVGELESALARRVHDLPRHEPPAGLLEQIEARLDQQPATGRTARSRPAPPPWAAIARWGIAAVIAVSLGTIAVQLLRRGPAAVGNPVVIFVGLDSRQSAFTELPLPPGPQDADTRFIQLASLAEKFWEKPENLPAPLPAPGQSGRGFALFDPVSNQGYIAIRQLPVTPPGQSYHLWIRDAGTGQVREAGVLPLTTANSGLYFFSVPSAGEAKAGRPGFFVTVEDTAAPASTKPRGKVVLGDKSI